MSRQEELDDLLKDIDSITNRVTGQPTVKPQPKAAAPKEESSFLKTLGGLFISKVDDETKTAVPVETAPPTPHTVSDMAGYTTQPEFSVPTSDDENPALKSFADIYSEAGIDEGSFTVDKLDALLQDPTMKEQPLSTKTLVLKMALKAQNISPETPVGDAVKRDRTLDGYQKMLNNRAHSTEERNSEAIQQINEQVRAYLEKKNAEMDALKTETQTVKQQAEEFAARRKEEEQRLANIIVPLLENQPNPVTVNNPPD
jgi:hypothetical protein